MKRWRPFWNGKESCPQDLETNHSTVPGKIITNWCQGVWRQLLRPTEVTPSTNQFEHVKLLKYSQWINFFVYSLHSFFLDGNGQFQAKMRGLLGSVRGAFEFSLDWLANVLANVHMPLVTTFFIYSMKYIFIWLINQYFWSNGDNHRVAVAYLPQTNSCKKSIKNFKVEIFHH